MTATITLNTVTGAVAADLLKQGKSLSQLLKELVGSGQMANITHYRKGDVWYCTDGGFDFPVPISDAGDATLQSTEKASMLMRYIRKHLETLNAASAI